MAKQAPQAHPVGSGSLLDCGAWPMMNKLLVGVNREHELPGGGYFFIDDEVPEVRRGKLFDPERHSFNPLEGMTYRRACYLVDALMALFPGGGSTLTKEGVPNVLLEAFLSKGARLDGLLEERSADPSYVSAKRMLERVMRSPVLRRVLCGEGERFSFSKDAKILARINRAELGEFDALALGLFLIGQTKGQVIVPEFGFYGRDLHVSLIREERLIAGVNFLSELRRQELLKDAVLLIKDKVGEGCLFEDAETLARYAGYMPGTVGFSTFVEKVVG